ncbi:MAG: hypothetical protein ABFE13_26925 [Phycisphaerales bacterium]
MSTIRAAPKHLFSWGFDLELDETSRITLDMAWLREGGRFTWSGTDYRLSREGPWTGDFLLTADDQVLARATKDSVFFRSFTIRLDGRELLFRAAAWLFRRFELIEGDSVIGEVVPDHFLTRACTVEFPDDLSVPVQVFLFWLAALMWRRQNNAAAGS